MSHRRQRHLNPRHTGATLVLEAPYHVGADGDLVSTWVDRSGNGYSPTASSTARPTFKTAIQGGQPVMRFDGNDELVIPTGPTVDAGQPFVLLLCSKQTTAGTLYNGILDFKSSVSENWQLLYTTSAAYAWLTFGATSTWARLRWNTTPDTAFKVFCIAYNGAGAGTDGNFEMKVNGATVSLVASSSYASNTSQASIGTYIPSNSLTGDIGAVTLVRAATSESLKRRLIHHYAALFKTLCN